VLHYPLVSKESHVDTVIYSVNCNLLMSYFPQNFTKSGHFSANLVKKISVGCLSN